MFLRTCLALALFCLLAVACVPAPAPPHFPEITFRTEAPFRIAAKTVEIVEAYVPPLRAPNVEHESPVPPSILLRRWAEQRLEAAGGLDRVRATITDASIVETELATNQTVETSFQTEQAFRFEARAAMRIELVDTAGVVRATVEGTAEQVRTLPENATLLERQEVLFQMSEDVARALDKVLGEILRQHFAAHLVR
ncbi:MAG: hypothetical protein VCC99_15750 [Alphaproteobacteria bacterium]